MLSKRGSGNCLSLVPSGPMHVRADWFKQTLIRELYFGMAKFSALVLAYLAVHRVKAKLTEWHYNQDVIVHRDRYHTLHIHYTVHELWAMNEQFAHVQNNLHLQYVPCYFSNSSFRLQTDYSYHVIYCNINAYHIIHNEAFLKSETCLSMHFILHALSLWHFFNYFYQFTVLEC